MVKSRANLSLEADTHERAKRVYDNLSERVQELLEQDMDISKMEDEEMIQDKISELEHEKKQLEAEIEARRDKLEGVESELTAARASLEQARREKEQQQDNLAMFHKVFSNKYIDAEKPELIEPGHKVPDRDGWAKPEHIPQKWVDETDLDREKLWEKGVEEVGE